MRVVIDLQGAQTESRYRGIGRYSLSIAKALAADRGDHEVIVLLNAALPSAMAEIRAQCAALLPAAQIKVFHGLTRVCGRDPLNGWRSAASALLREAYIAGLEADAVFVPALFEGYVDDATLSVGTLFPVPTTVTVHDLIPQLNPAQYLDHDPLYKRFYADKIAQLKLAAALAAVSESAAGEATALLDFDPARIVDTAEAADSLFHPLSLSPAQSRALRQSFGITKPFVFYAGGGDPRKNLAALVRAFSSLASPLRDGHQLVIAGRLSSGDRGLIELAATKCGLDPQSLVFLGYVSDPDLARLYNDCAVFVMPSLHEGFGLPALEAMQCGAPTIGSNTSSIPEVIGLPEALFDPREDGEIASKITRVLSEPAFRQRLIDHGLARAATFSWPISAKKIMQLVETTVSKPTQTRDWPEWRIFADGLEHSLLNALTELSAQVEPTEQDWLDIAQSIADNRLALDAGKRSTVLPDSQSWRIEGPFDSSYSLALVNRELARGLVTRGHDVALHSAEGDGSLVTDPGFLARETALAPLFTTEPVAPSTSILARNMYPPRVADMTARINVLHNYAWEETGFPADWVDQFNDYLQGVTVTAEHVKKLLIDNGVRVPITVVGNGVDHWERIAADADYPLKAKSFRFLHVSSGFPRKGLDVLLHAYAEAFTSRDDVSLVIKTFPNIHNTTSQQIAALRDTYPELGDIVLIDADLSDASLKALYGQCQVLVAPSRAEGFGLPIAEALLSGLAVLATGWSGQMDFLKDDPASLIDFSFATAQSHLPVFDSVWAEPDSADMQRLMRLAVNENPADRTARVARQRTALLERFTWDRVAAAATGAVAGFASQGMEPAPEIAWVSTFAARCGIATYSKHLIDAITAPVRIYAASDSTEQLAEGYDYVRCWHQGEVTLDRLTQRVLADRSAVVVVQFNYAFFDFAALRVFLRALLESGRIVVVELHATIDPAHDPSKKLAALVPELAQCQRLLVHSVGDLNRLKALGLVDNVTLFPHGVLDRLSIAPKAGPEKIIASYGFFLTNKGLIELIEAFAILRRDGFAGRLRMVNAEFPAPVSAALVAEARQRIKALGLRGAIDLHTGFLSDADSLALLAPAQLVVYPYQQTAESASGAVRYGLASELPVATTPLSIFDDVSSVVFQLPGTSPEQMAQGIRDLLARLDRDDAEVRAVKARAAAWRSAHLYSRLGRRMTGMLQALALDHKKR